MFTTVPYPLPKEQTAICEFSDLKNVTHIKKVRKFWLIIPYWGLGRWLTPVIPPTLKAIGRRVVVENSTLSEKQSKKGLEVWLKW
jgi:hypothetical protein